MARGSKEKYTSKQKRQAHHIEDSAKKQGYSAKRAAQIGWATVNKETGGSSVMSHAKRSKAAKKGWQTRRHEGSRHATH